MVFHQYFTYFMTTSFIGGGNRRKSPTCRKSLDKLYHIMFYRAWAGFELTTLMVIGTDCTSTFCVHCSYNSNYHTITTTTSPTSKSLLTLHILQMIQLNIYNTSIELIEFWRRLSQWEIAPLYNNTCIQSDIFIIYILQSVSTFTVYKGMA
jgi:hypothetical protein